MRYCDMYMVQSATRIISELTEPSLILTDEAAHASANTYKKIYTSFPNALHIGFTASPCRITGKPLGDVFDCLVEGVSVPWLIDNEKLSPYKYYSAQLADFSSVKKRAGDYSTDELSNIMSKPKIFGDIIEHYKKFANGKKAICYSPSVQYSINMCAEFNNNGINAAHIDGTTPSDTRRDVMQAFREGAIRILCNNEIISEGVSIDDCESVILLRKTASLALYIQQVGRSMRYKPGKTAIIIDHVGNYLLHGLPDTVREWSLDCNIKPHSQYNVNGTLKIRQCPKCFYTFPTAPICPNCGEAYIVTREEIKQIREVELQEIKQRQEEYKTKYKEDCKTVVERYNSVQQCRNMTELMQWCKINNLKSGYGYHMGKIMGFIRK